MNELEYEDEGFDSDDEAEDDEEDKARNAHHQALANRYRCFSLQTFWGAYNKGLKDFDLADDELCELISRGYVVDGDLELASKGPPAEIMREAWVERRDSGNEMFHPNRTLAFQRWFEGIIFGIDYRDITITTLPSFDMISEAEAEEITRNEVQKAIAAAKERA